MEIFKEPEEAKQSYRRRKTERSKQSYRRGKTELLEEKNRAIEGISGVLGAIYAKGRTIKSIAYAKSIMKEYKERRSIYMYRCDIITWTQTGYNNNPQYDTISMFNS